MSINRAVLLIVIAAGSSSLGQVRAAEPRRSQQQRTPTVSSNTLTDILADTRYRLVDGKLVPVTSGGASRGGSNSPPPSAPAPSVALPFDHFDAGDDGSSIINSYFLAYLSFLVYSSEIEVDDFEDELRETLLPQGVVDVQAFMNSFGVEGAIVYTPDAAIVVFRGTSTEGASWNNYFYNDYASDINDAPQQVNIGGKDVYVHEGFCGAANSIYPFILEQAAIAALDGRKIWVTGHSLGAAIATLTAFRLHYDDGVTVQGLQTFGSPKVGDADMAVVFHDKNIDGVELADATVRWVVDGDPVTTFFEKEMIGVNFFGPIWVYYEHVGVTNTIYPLENGGFEVKYDTGEDKYMYWEVGGLNDEHQWYLPGLTAEMSLALLEAGELGVLEEVLQAP